MTKLRTKPILLRTFQCFPVVGLDHLDPPKMDTLTLNAALVARFTQPESTTSEKPLLDTCAVLEGLRILQLEGINGFSVSRALDEQNPRNSLPPEHHALVSFLDVCCSAFVKRAEFPDDVSRQLMRVVVCIVRVGLSEGLLELSRDHVVLRVLESLVDLAIGWTDVGGKAKVRLEEKLQDSIRGLSLITEKYSVDCADSSARTYLLSLMHADIQRFTTTERLRIGKLEKRIVDAEAGQLKRARSRKLAAQLINTQMENKVLPALIVKFLQGVWFDSLQLTLTRKGLNSAEWVKATRLTETLIMTLQPANTEAATSDEPKTEMQTAPGTFLSQDLYRIIEHLPHELKESLVSLQHDVRAADAALADIENVCVDVMTAVELIHHEYEPILVDDGLIQDNTSVSQSLLEPVKKLATGQWMVYAQEGEKSKHIRLTLKMDELKQLVFTNHNGAKVLQVSFDELAYLLGSGSVTLLPASSAISSQLRARLKKILKPDPKQGGVAERKSRLKVPTPIEQRSLEESSANLGGNRLEPDIEAVKVLTAELDARLVFGAIFLLNMGDQLVEARIAVDDPGENKIIFVDRKGFNLGEFSRDEVADLVKQGNCEFVNCGGPDLFREVITRLKNKRGLTEDS